MPKTILVVDDDPVILKLVRKYFLNSEFVVVSTDNGSEALMLVRESQPNLILVDAEMPGLDGHAVCRVLKQEASTQSIPVIIMSGSRTADKDIVCGLEGGADDYLSKPFALSVLRARILAVLKRCSAAPIADARVRKRGLEIDPAGRTVKVGGKPVSLTRKEFDLLAALISKAGRVLGITYLLETVWGYDPADYNDPRTVEVHISHLRKKLGSALAKRIVNVQGHGYRFDE
ncbi:MAG: response regulator transcription factor [Elusimicrobia bacterium]|nr:response regulator transcription factor [Elusimicrobiota bacterium]